MPRCGIAPHEDKSVKVEFNFSDQYLLVLDFVQQNTVEPPGLTLEKKNKNL